MAGDLGEPLPSSAVKQLGNGVKEQRQHKRGGEQGQQRQLDPARGAFEGLGEFLNRGHRRRDRNHVRRQQANPGLGQAEGTFDGAVESGGGGVGGSGSASGGGRGIGRGHLAPSLPQAKPRE